MSSTLNVPVKNSELTWEKYQQFYKLSVENPDAFWAHQADSLSWFKKWNKVKTTNFHSPVTIEWFAGGQLNVSQKCIDRHLEHRGDKKSVIINCPYP